MRIEYEPGGAAYIGKNEDIYITIIDVYDNRILFDCDGYSYDLGIVSTRTFNRNIRSMTEESFVRYINDKYLSGTEIEAIGSCRITNYRTPIVINKETGIEYKCRTNPQKLDVIRLATNRVK